MLLCEITMILRLILISGLLVLSSTATAKCFKLAYKLAIENVSVCLLLKFVENN